jgi:hypothetical protein
LEAGLKTAGIAIRERQYPLQERDPTKWRQYLLGLWQRHQHKSAVQQLDPSQLLIAQQLLTPFLRPVSSNGTESHAVSLLPSRLYFACWT